MKPSDPAFTKAIGHLAYSSQARTIAYAQRGGLSCGRHWVARPGCGYSSIIWSGVDTSPHLPTPPDAYKQKVLNRWNVASRETRSIWLTRCGGFSLAEQQQIISPPGRQLKSHHKERLWKNWWKILLVYRLRQRCIYPSFPSHLLTFLGRYVICVATITALSVS
jgi:hypothetical protein